MLRLTINFGHNGVKKQVNWYKDIMDFPKLLRFQGKSWEWAIYQNMGNDYELTFSQIPTYDPNYYTEMPSYENMFEFSGSDVCECGSAYSSFKFDHMMFCKLWKPWGKW